MAVAAPAAEERIYALKELPDDIRNSLPALTVGGALRDAHLERARHAPNAAQRSTGTSRPREAAWGASSTIRAWRRVRHPVNATGNARRRCVQASETSS